MPKRKRASQASRSHQVPNDVEQYDTLDTQITPEPEQLCSSPRVEKRGRPSLLQVGCPHDVPSTGGSHSYGPAVANDNAIIQMGDSNYDIAAGSTIQSHANVTGDFNVSVHRAFFQHNHDIFRDKTEEEKMVALKRAIYYNSMDDRPAQIRDANPGSLNWIWDETQFAAWLRSEQPIFCITGKPASGKSTLMHHLTSDPAGVTEVRRHLDANGQAWKLLRFYFDYGAGGHIANTTLGMLRSFLFQLVEYSSEVKVFVTRACEHRLSGNWPTHSRELESLISSAMRSADLAVCGFIDGLDEYTGNIRELADTIIRLQKQTNMKRVSLVGLGQSLSTSFEAVQGS